jgi:hypothetical protein
MPCQTVQIPLRFGEQTFKNFMAVSSGLSEIAHILENSADFGDVKIKFTGLAPGISDQELLISSPLDLTFDPNSLIMCKRLIISDCGVHTSGLTLCRMMTIDNARVSLLSCWFHHPSEWADYLLSATNSSRVLMSTSIFEEPVHSGLSADNNMFFELHSCVLRKLSRFPISLSGSSLLESAWCDYEENG